MCTFGLVVSDGREILERRCHRARVGRVCVDAWTAVRVLEQVTARNIAILLRDDL